MEFFRGKVNKWARFEGRLGVEGSHLVKVDIAAISWEEGVLQVLDRIVVAYESQIARGGEEIVVYLAPHIDRLSYVGLAKGQRNFGKLAVMLEGFMNISEALVSCHQVVSITFLFISLLIIVIQGIRLLE